MKNFWIEYAQTVVESEILLVRNSPNTKSWFDKMPTKISAICPSKKVLSPKTFKLRPEDFTPVVGFAHHMRFSRLGIEAVLRTTRKYHRLSHYVLYDKVNQPSEPFWLILYK